MKLIRSSEVNVMLHYSLKIISMDTFEGYSEVDEANKICTKSTICLSEQKLI